MRINCAILLVLLLLSHCSTAFADRQLERTEILQIFEKITKQPRKTWIPAGTIEARHEEYRSPQEISPSEIGRRIKREIALYQCKEDRKEIAPELQKMKLDAIPFNTRYELSNKYAMSSAVIVKFDGDRFYWEINVDSRTDSVRPNKDLEGNFMTDQFNMEWNARRIFTWDGEKYTTYFLPGNYSIVDTTNMTQHVVNGPLTAGIIPWGYGYYTYESLSAVDSYGVEKYVDGRLLIYLTLSNLGGLEMLFIMDPVEDYAVLSCLVKGYNDVIISRHYSGYQLIAGNLVPSVILLERYEADTNKLLASDLWQITGIDTSVPESYEFNVAYEDNASIEHYAFADNIPEMYRYSKTVDTDELLAERLAYTVNEGLQSQNCATAALKYAIGRLGKKVTDQELAYLVNKLDNTTSLYQMKLFAQRMGFYCKAVKTDIETLKSLDNCEIILHIPGKGHFVVVSDIDNEFIKIVDLTDNKFYYHTDLNFFPMDWTEGTALLISNDFIEGKYLEIDEREMDNIRGGLGYDCNILRQIFKIVPCEPVGGECGAYVRVFFPRWGCGLDDSGSCSESMMVRYMKAPCVEIDLFSCQVQGDWIYYYMMACK